MTYKIKNESTEKEIHKVVILVDEKQSDLIIHWLLFIYNYCLKTT